MKKRGNERLYKGCVISLLKRHRERRWVSERMQKRTKKEREGEKRKTREGANELLLLTSAEFEFVGTLRS